MERMMKAQEVILKAAGGKLKWWEAAEIMGVTDRTMRRWRERLNQHGYMGLWDTVNVSPARSGYRWQPSRRSCSSIVSSTLTSTCGTFTRSCEKSTESS